MYVFVWSHVISPNFKYLGGLTFLLRGLPLLFCGLTLLFRGRTFLSSVRTIYVDDTNALCSVLLSLSLPLSLSLSLSLCLSLSPSSISLFIQRIGFGFLNQKFVILEHFTVYFYSKTRNTKSIILG